MNEPLRPGPMEELFAKRTIPVVRKQLRHILKRTGWGSVRILHLGLAQHRGIPEMLEWWNELFNQAAGELGGSRWEVPFETIAFTEPCILPSGQVVEIDDILPRFFKTIQKFKRLLQHNTGQLVPLSEVLTVRGGRLVLIEPGRTRDLEDRGDRRLLLGDRVGADRLEEWCAASADDFLSRLVTEDDFALITAVTAQMAPPVIGSISTHGDRIVVLHGICCAGLVTRLRDSLPGVIFFWRNQLGTSDPTPAVWNYLVQAANQTQGMIADRPEDHPADLERLEPLRVRVLVQPPAIYPGSPKNRDLNGLGAPLVKRLLAQYQRDYILVQKFEIRHRLEQAWLKTQGRRATDQELETLLDSLTKASIRAAFIEDGRRPEVEPFLTRAAVHASGLLELVRQIHGIDPARAVFAQIGRFDPFKDPVGAVAAFVNAYLRLVQEGLPLEQRPQFVLAGSLDEYGEESTEELVRVFRYLDSVPALIQEEFAQRSLEEREDLYRLLRRDIFVLLLPDRDAVANALEINALQRTARAIVQKSVHENFSLAVCEAMWKGVPVIGGNAGGIRSQIDHGIDGFLVGQVVDGKLRDSVEDATQYLITYSKYAETAERMGEMARRKIGKEYLMSSSLESLVKKLADTLAQLDHKHLRSPGSAAA